MPKILLCRVMEWLVSNKYQTTTKKTKTVFNHLSLKACVLNM